MPSPFRGMDPYLEEPERWSDVQIASIVLIQAAIQRQLPDPYYATIKRRTRIEYPEWYDPDHPEQNDPRRRKDFVPDVLVGGPADTADAGGVALAEPGGAVAIEPDWNYDPAIEIREPYLEIFTRVGSRRRLVTSIEVLSPTNKTADGGEAYRTKQYETLHSGVHLLEIDLLRAGRHTTAVPLSALRKSVPEWDYHVCLSRFDARRRFFVWTVRLGERLPELEVPLLPEDGSVRVDLQEILDATYEAGPFFREVDYAAPPPAPPVDAAVLAAARVTADNTSTTDGP